MHRLLKSSHCQKQTRRKYFFGCRRFQQQRGWHIKEIYVRDIKRCTLRGYKCVPCYELDQLTTISRECADANLTAASS